MKSDCEGCSMYSMGNDQCKTDLEYYPDLVNSCPCRICVVKVICNTVCEDYQDVAMTGMYRESLRSPRALPRRRI